MFKRILSFLAISTVFLLLSGATAQANTSGAFNIFGTDGEALGKANAFTAEADNPSAVHFNPAGTTQLEDGTHVSVGMAIIKPLVTHTDSSGVETDMRENKFWIPSVYVVSDLGIEDFSFGLGVKTNFGAGTDWAEDSFSRFVATKTVLESIDYSLTGAYQVNDSFSVGAGFDIVDTKLSESSAINQLGGTQGGSQIKVDDVAYGYSLSTLYKVNEEHRLGLIYRSAVELEMDGMVHLDSLSTSGSNLATIFGGTSYQTKAVGNLELPQSIVLGYSFQPDDSKWLFNFDATWMNWGSIEQQNFDFPNESNATRQLVLNSSADLELDWESTISYGVGTEYAYSDTVRLRGGYAYNPSPIPDANFHTFLPDGDSHNVSAGVGWSIKEDLVLDASYMAMMFEDRDIANNVGAAVGADIDGEYEEYIHVGVVTITKSF